MEDDISTPKLVQLHSYITLENEQRMVAYQALMQLKKNRKIAKQAIVNEALSDYLLYKIQKLEEDGK